MAWRSSLVLGAVALSALAAGCAKQTNAAASASAAVPTSTAVATAVAQESVPVVGCRSDGQVGPRAAPTHAPVALPIDASAAEKLALYAMEDGPDVLAPRGWSCAGIYGSDGGTLVVAPHPLAPADLMGAGWAGATGDAVEARIASGDTSGRFEVAKTIARVFPSRMALVRAAIGEDLGYTAADFPTGPFPTDKLTRPSEGIVEFQTPANTIGLGTDPNQNERMRPGADPVQGVVVLTEPTPDLLAATVRLPAALQSLAPVIVQQFGASQIEDGGGPASSSSAH